MKNSSWNGGQRNVLYWNEGQVRFYNAAERSWRELGRMHCKENVAIWCRRYGVIFRDRSVGSAELNRVR